MSLMMPDGKSWTTTFGQQQPSQQPTQQQNKLPEGWAYSTTQQQPATPTKQSGAMDLSAYSPGKAQPTQTPSLGSAYAPSNEGLVWNQTEQAFLPPAQQPAPQQPAMQQPATMPAGVYGPGGEYYGSNQSQGLAAAMRQRDAFVQQTNQAMMPYEVANFTKQDFGAPQFDLQGMRNSASQMVQDGFYNPFTKYFEQQPQTMAPESLNPYAPPSLYGNPYGMPQTNPYFMQPPPMFGGPMMPPTAPPMQADPYQDFISSLPGYQPRDQWMPKQAPVGKSPNDRPGMTYVPAEYRDGKLWSDAHYVNNAPPIPEYAPDWVTKQPARAPRTGAEFSDPATGAPVFRDADGRLMWTPGPFQVMEPYVPGGRQPMGDDYTGPILPEWRRPAQPGFDYRLPKRDPRLEIESLRQQTLADLPYWSGRPDAPTGSVWDQPENAAVRERLLKETAEYDRDPYTTGGWLTAPPGNNASQPGLIDPRYTPPASPGGRYTPVAPRDDSQTRDMRPQYDNAGRFIQELTRTNPATWTETQWADYKRAQMDTGLMDSGGYYRDQQGNVRYGGGYGPADRPADPTIGRDSRQDQYGTWGGSGGGSYSRARPGQAQPIQPQSQGTPYGGKLIDIDKDGVDDRQQYGSPQEAMAARDRGTARAAAAQKLGFQSTDQIDIASTLLNTSGARDKSRDFYGIQTLDSPLSYTQRADRLVERLGLLENAGATITPAERAAAESLAAVLRNPANASLNMGTPSQAGELALFNSRVSQAEQALRSATEEGDRWRELSGYEKQWGGAPSTPPPAALNAAMDRDAQNAADIKLQREASARADALYAKEREKRILASGGARGPMPGQLLSAQQVAQQNLAELQRKVMVGTATPSERDAYRNAAGNAAYNSTASQMNMGRGGGAMR